MANRIDLFHFGDCGFYDEHNPIKIYKEEHVPELLYLIANEKPYRYDNLELARTLDEDTKIIKDKLNKLVKLNMIDSKLGKYKISFTILLKKDIPVIEQIANKISIKVGNILLDNSTEIQELVKQMDNSKTFNSKRILYHVIGDRTFDGRALTYFADQGLFKISKPQPDNRNYILIGYESSEELNKFSQNLLCSSNNIKSGKYCFNSFGDSNGNRKDMYRFLRQNQLAISHATQNHALNELYNKINDDYNLKLIDTLGKRIEEILEGEMIFDIYTEFLKEMGYIEYYNTKIKVKVPVFKGDDRVIETKIINKVLELIEREVSTFFLNNNLFKQLTAVKHEVPIDEVSNELWHLVFGQINEFLIKKGFFAEPQLINGQGRYFQSIYID